MLNDGGHGKLKLCKLYILIVNLFILIMEIHVFHSQRSCIIQSAPLILNSRGLCLMILFSFGLPKLVWGGEHATFEPQGSLASSKDLKIEKSGYLFLHSSLVPLIPSKKILHHYQNLNFTSGFGRK